MTDYPYIQRTESQRPRKTRTFLDLAENLVNLPYAEAEMKILGNLASDQVFREFEARYPDPEERRKALFNHLYGGTDGR